MRRVQLYLEDSMDDRLEDEARRRGTSKAALVRQAVARAYPAPEPREEDGLAALDGLFEAEPTEHIDDVIYRLGH